MLIVLLRHGETAYNAQRRYQGKSDIPLSARGKARLRAADFAPDRKPSPMTAGWMCSSCARWGGSPSPNC